MGNRLKMDLGMEQEWDYILLANAVQLGNTQWQCLAIEFTRRALHALDLNHWSDSINGIISDLNRSS